MPRRMEADVDLADTSPLAVGLRLDVRVGQPASKHRFARRRTQVRRRPGVRVVAVGMSNQGAVDGKPRVYVESACLAVQTRRSLDDHDVSYGSMSPA